MHDEDVWALEESLWTGGAAQMQAALDPACLMVFPPGSILDAGAAIAGLAAAPRWRCVEMADRRLARPTPDLVVLAYRATAKRDGEAPYAAWCSSTYRRNGERWRLVQHQHTPAMS